MQLSATDQPGTSPSADGSCRQPKQVLLAINPKAGSGDREHLLAEVIKQLAEAGFTSQRMTDVNLLREEVTKLQQTGDLRAVIIAGGDGSARLIAEELPANTPLVMMPMGTENLLAKHLGYRPHVQSVVNAVVAGEPVQMDAGLANGRLVLLLSDY